MIRPILCSRALAVVVGVLLLLSHCGGQEKDRQASQRQIALARELLELQLIQQAKSCLETELADLEPSAWQTPPASTRATYLERLELYLDATELLASLYVRSRLFDEAIGLLNDNRNRLRQLSLPTMSWEVRFTQLQILAHVANSRQFGRDQERVAQDFSTAKQVWRQTYRSELRGIDRLQMLSARANLAEAMNAAQLAAENSDWSHPAIHWRHTATAAAQLRGALRSNTGDYLTAAHILVRCLASLSAHEPTLKHHDRIANETRSLLGKFEPAERDVHGRALWRDVAQVYRNSQQFSLEADAWKRAGEHNGRLLQLPTDDPLPEIQNGIHAGDYLRFQARALRDSGYHRKAVPLLADSKQHYQDAIAQLNKQPGGSDEHELAKQNALRMTGLQGLLSASQMWFNYQYQLTVASSTDQASDLQRRVASNLLVSDARVHVAKLNLAATLLRDRRYVDARQLLLEAKHFFDGNPDPVAAVRVRNMLAEAELDPFAQSHGALSGNELEDAEQYIAEAKSIFERAELDNPTLDFSLRINTGRVQTLAGDYRQAQQTFADIVQRARSLGPAANEIISVANRNQGIAYLALFNLSDAIRCCSDAIEMAGANAATSPHDLLQYRLALADALLGRWAEERQDSDGAFERIQQLDTHARSVQLDPEWAFLRNEVTHRLALAYRLRSRSGSALSADQAIALWRELLLQPELRDSMLHARARVYLSELIMQVAERRVKDEWSQQGRDDWRTFLQERGAFNADKTDYQAKKRDYDDSGRRLGSYEELRRTFDQLKQRQTRLTNRRKRLERNLRRDPELTSEALALSQQAIDQLQQHLHHPGLFYRANLNHGSIQMSLAEDAVGVEERTHRYTTAINHLQKAADLAEFIFAMNFDEDQRKDELFLRYNVAHHLLVDCYVAISGLDAQSCEEYLRRALVHAELARNRTAVKNIAVERSRSEAEPTKLGLSANLRRDFISGQVHSDRGAAAQLRKELSSYSENCHLPPDLLDPDRVRAVVDKWVDSKAAESLWYYHVGPRNSFLFLLGMKPGTIELRRLENQNPPTLWDRWVDDNTIQSWVQKFHESVQGLDTHVSFPEQEQISVTNCLVPQDIRSSLKSAKLKNARFDGITHVTVIPGGHLHSVPFEALRVDDAQYLIDELNPADSLRFVFNYAPCLVYLDSLTIRQEQVPRGQQPHLLASAKEDFAPPLARLPGLIASAKEISRQWFSSSLLEDPTELQLRHAIRQMHSSGGSYYLLLQTHAIDTDSADTTRARLVVKRSPENTSDNRPDDDSLSVHDIYQMDFPSCQLAVLGACSTNLGVSRASSLSSAFLAKGAHQVIASQWNVRLGSSKKLLQLLFNGLRNSHDVSVALHRARVQLRRENPAWDSPVHWAPYVVLGPSGSVKD